MENDKRAAALKALKEKKLREMVNADYQDSSSETYEQSSEVVEAENKALHSAGEMQRQTSRQMFNKEQEAKDRALAIKEERERIKKRK